jgi:hypothetical protein
VASKKAAVPLTLDDLRAVAAYASACALDALSLFEEACPDDPRPRTAIETSLAFAQGGKRGKAIRDAAWGTMRAGHAADDKAAAHAARAAMGAASAAYLHPLADADQVKHILGAAAFAARALELAAGDDPAVGLKQIRRAARRAKPAVLDVLRRYPAAPAGGGRVGELLRTLDAALRGRVGRSNLRKRPRST